MQHTVRGAAECHIDRKSVHNGVLRHDVTRANIFSQHIHDRHACVLCKFDTCGIYRRDGAVAAQTHAEGFSQAVHGVCGVHAGAGAACRAGLALIFAQLFFGNLTGVEFAHRLRNGGEARFCAVYVARKHRAAADKHRRHVKARRRHQKARHILVAVRHHDERIKAVCQCHGFGGIRNEVARDERILHAGVAHCNAVAYRNRREDNRRAACHRNADLYGVHNLIDIHVARDDLVIGADDADERTFDLLLREAQSMVQRTVRRVLRTDFQRITFHFISSIREILAVARRPTWKNAPCVNRV